jgi:hypothetical protein
MDQTLGNRNVFEVVCKKLQKTESDKSRSRILLLTSEMVVLGDIHSVQSSVSKCKKRLIYLFRPHTHADP